MNIHQKAESMFEKLYLSKDRKVLFKVIMYLLRHHPKAFIDGVVYALGEETQEVSSKPLKTRVEQLFDQYREEGIEHVADYLMCDPSRKLHAIKELRAIKKLRLEEAKLVVDQMYADITNAMAIDKSKRR